VSLLDQMTQEMKTAMRAKDKVRLGAIRNIRAAFLTEMKKTGADSLSDDTAVGVLRKIAKSHRESIDAYSGTGRDDLIEKEQAELAVVESFLPQLADEAQTTEWVKEAIAATGATSPKEMGKVMGQVMRFHKADVDGNMVRQIASKLLA